MTVLDLALCLGEHNTTGHYKAFTTPPQPMGSKLQVRLWAVSTPWTAPAETKSVSNVIPCNVDYIMGSIYAYTIQNMLFVIFSIKLWGHLWITLWCLILGPCCLLPSVFTTLSESRRYNHRNLKRFLLLWHGIYGCMEILKTIWYLVASSGLILIKELEDSSQEAR